MPKQILELSTLTPDRLAVNIDGKLYEIKDRSEIGVENLVTLQSLYNEIERLRNYSADELDEEVGRVLSFQMDKLCRLLLMNCPEEIHRKLQDSHRLSIFMAFQQAVGGENMQQTQPLNRRQRRTKATSAS